MKKGLIIEVNGLGFGNPHLTVKQISECPTCHEQQVKDTIYSLNEEVQIRINGEDSTTFLLSKIRKL